MPSRTFWFLTTGVPIKTEEYNMNVSQQNPDGSFSPAEPLSMIGWKAKLEEFFRRMRLKKLANVMASWDERGLG